MLRPKVIVASSVVLLIAGLIGIQIRHKGQGNHPSTHPPASSARSASLQTSVAPEGSFAPNRVTPAFTDVNDQKAADLMCRYEMEGAIAALHEAQRLSPGNRQVIIASALLASDPDDPWLRKLEESQPNNALPNLIRAALHAKKGDADLAKFKNELETAVDKQPSDLGTRERQTAVLDRLLATPELMKSDYFSLRLEKMFGNQVEQLINGLVSHPTLFGDENATASVAVSLANQFREMSDLDFSMSLAGNYLEQEMLRKVRGTDDYDETGKTVAQRQEELSQILIDYERQVIIFRKHVWEENADPTMRLHFFAKMQSGGEKAAYEWLLRNAAELPQSP